MLITSFDNSLLITFAKREKRFLTFPFLAAYFTF